MVPQKSMLTRFDYHVAWICPLADVELLPAILMLDKQHLTPEYDTNYDENTYLCGEIQHHAVVIATCPPGSTGNINAGRLTGSLFKTFPNIRMAIIVGIGGGIPRLPASLDPLKDIHLGDVVVGCPGDGKPACVFYGSGALKSGRRLETTCTMQEPDYRLKSAFAILRSNHELGRTTFELQRKRLQKYEKFAYPGFEHDRLFKATHQHIGGHASDCDSCNQGEIIKRIPRNEVQRHQLIFHEGRIAVGNITVRDGEVRDQISTICDGALCVETEAAGVDVNRRCLVVRGISDYADSHSNDKWKFYAAGCAAAFTRELLCTTQASNTSIETFKTPSVIPNYVQVASNPGASTSGITRMQPSKSNEKHIAKIPKTGQHWSEAEDEQLLRVVGTMGKPHWKTVAQYFHRNDWACQKRYERLTR